MINGHGDDIYSYGKEIVSNFSSNIYNRLDLSGLDNFLCQRISSIHSYPEPDAASLTQMIADRANVGRASICLANGATEAIYMIAHALKGKKATILIPTFSEYEDACIANGIQTDYVASLYKVSTDTELLWLCNPNNPTGKTIDKGDVISFIQDHPRTIIVIDQSYAYFSPKDSLSISEAIQYPNVIQLHSMTKRYAIPGLRLGYFSAHKDLLAQIVHFRMPWAVNQLAIEAGKYLLENDFSLEFDLIGYLKETEQLCNELNSTNILTAYPTDTHYFLCKLHNHKASELKAWLVHNHSILIRDASNFRGLDEHFFRIATQSATENKNLVKAIKEWAK